MPIPFPPGDIPFTSNAPRSPWREFAFILHQIQRAVEPGLSLAGTIGDWPRLSQPQVQQTRVFFPKSPNFVQRDIWGEAAAAPLPSRERG